MSAKIANTRSQTARTRNNPSKLFTSGSKAPAGALTSEVVASDVAAFKKAGGRIEVLGNTAFRTTSAFRSRGNTPRAATQEKPAAATKADG